MKTDIRLFGALACVLGLTVGAFGAGTEPIVTNGGYEANADGKVAGWSAQGKYAFRPGEGINGTGAFYYDNDNPKYYGVPGQKIKLEPGRRYKFSAEVHSDSHPSSQ